MGQQRRRAVALVAALAVLGMGAACRPGGGGGSTTTRPGPVTTSPGGGGRNPVVFVHGFGGSRTQFRAAINNFQSRGYPASHLLGISYSDTASIETSAQTLAREVNGLLQRTGASKVDIVSHSMGSMVAKTCIIIDGCKGKTGHWNSISGVDNGTAFQLPAAGAADDDVQGRTPLRRQLQQGWQEGIVNQGVKVQVHWSANDGIVVPGSLSQQPPPAVNIAKPGLNHFSIYSNAGVISEIYTFFGT